MKPLLAILIAAALLQAPAVATPAGLPYSQMSHFRDVWTSDTCVRQHGQSWDDYWYWVQRFYNGKSGWLSQSEGVVSKVRDADTRAKLATRLQLLGIRVGGEWSKTNACRKIRTTTGFFNFTERGKPALTSWGRELQDAARRDTGDGVAISAAIDDITRQVDKVLGPSL